MNLQLIKKGTFSIYYLDIIPVVEYNVNVLFIFNYIAVMMKEIQMKYVSTTEIGKNGVLQPDEFEHFVRIFGNKWFIPEDSDKPADARIKSG